MSLLQRIQRCFLAESKTPAPQPTPTSEPEPQRSSVPQAILTDEELRFILDLYN